MKETEEVLVLPSVDAYCAMFSHKKCFVSQLFIVESALRRLSELSKFVFKELSFFVFIPKFLPRDAL